MSTYGYSMPRYFQDMPTVGKPLLSENDENRDAIVKVEEEIKQLIADALAAGRSDESLNEKGQLTAMQRIEALVDDGTWCPLNSLYNPNDNENGSTSVVKGIGRVGGKWAVVVASDNKKRAGAWVPGQAENLLKAADTSHISAQLLRR